MEIIRSTSIELKSGMLLSQEILKEMNEQSILFRLQYEDYLDGFIYGFELKKDGDLYLTPRALKA